MIPRLLHQTHASWDLPPAVLSGMAELSRLNPGWKHVFYTDADCVDFIRASYQPEVLQAYLSIDPAYGAARSDLFRYLLLYKLGGVYLDVKSSVDRPLNEVVRGESYLLSFWDNGPDGAYPGWGRQIDTLPRGEFQQWYIAAEPRHPFLGQVIRRVLHNIQHYAPERDGVGKRGVLQTTGPVAYTRAIAPRLALAPHRLAATNRELGFIYSIYGDDADSGHEHMKMVSAPHYSQLRTPIVRRDSATATA